MSNRKKADCKSDYDKKTYVKKSGATHHTNFVDKKTGEYIDADYITGWNASKSRGMITVIASPHKDKEKRETANKNYEVWMCKVNFKQRLEVKWYLGFYNKIKKKLTIPDMEMVVNPKAKNGGYMGTFVEKN